MNTINFIVKKLFRKLNLNKKSEIANFPFSGNSIIGYEKPIIFDNDQENQFYSRYYNEHVLDCDNINNFFHLQSNHLFKIELLNAKKYFKNKVFNIQSKEDALLPISGSLHEKQDFEIQVEQKKNQITINPQRFQYIKILKNQKIKITSGEDFLIGNCIKLNQKKKNKYRIVCLLFVDGLYDLENLGLGSIKELMPNTYNFFAKGSYFKSHYANAEWTLASFASIFSGGYSSGHGFFHPRKNHLIGKGHQIISELFKQEGYMTFQVGGGWRMNPAYGYIKGFDRSVYQREMDCKQVIFEFIENNNAFKNRDQFIWLNFNELHHFLKILPSIQSQSKLSHNYLIKSKKEKTKSLFNKYDPVKIEILKNEMTRLDSYLEIFYDYILRNYSDDEFLVNLVTDHGHAFLDKSEYILSDSRNRIPWFIRGKDIPIGKFTELTENVDIFQTLVSKCNLSQKNILHDGNLPSSIGGQENRKYTFTQSIYPNQKYKSVLKDNNYEFRFETDAVVSERGLINIKNIDTNLIERKTGKIVQMPEISNNYKSICLENINKWNNYVNGLNNEK